MIATHIVSSIICDTFTREVGKFQSKKDPQLAMVVDFSLSIDYDKEDGYRHLQILIWSEFNYVGVFWRETWNVRQRIFSRDDIHRELKPGPYEEGESQWECKSYHDSGWVEGVERILSEYERRIISMSTHGNHGWFSIDKLTEENQLPELRTALDKH